MTCTWLLAIVAPIILRSVPTRGYAAATGRGKAHDRTPPPEVCARLHVQAQPAALPPRWAPVREHFPLIAIADGSTLEALRKKTQEWRERAGLVLAGKLMVMVEAFSHRPLWQGYTEDALANDKRFAAEILAALPVGACWCLTWGFSAFCGEASRHT